MSTKTDDVLIDALADLSTLYPNLRLGQLLEMVAMLCCEETPLGAADVEDDRLLNTAADHTRARRERLKTEEEPIQESPLPPFRAELLDVLHRVREHDRDQRFGHLVAHLATSSGNSLYDAEDEQLLVAARGYPVR